MEKLVVLNYPVHAGTFSELTEALALGLLRDGYQHVVTLNPEMLMHGESDPRFSKILKSADIVLPDGAGIIWALKRLYGIKVQRIPGIEFSEAVIADAAAKGEPIALIGTRQEINQAALENLKERYPGLIVSYARHGFFSTPEERKEAAVECAKSNPRYVFVALGVPAQEFWIEEFRHLFTPPVAFIGVGGSFDIWSGIKSRAHPIFRKLNLEWLYRITSEPYRMKRVYRTLPMFVIKVLLQSYKFV